MFIIVAVIYWCTIKKDGRQLVALTISYDPDPTDEGKYFLIADKTSAIKLNLNQTFIVQRA